MVHPAGNGQGSIDQMITGISNPPPYSQQLWGEGLSRGRVISGPRTEKSVQNEFGQRQVDAEGNGKPLH